MTYKAGTILYSSRTNEIYDRHRRCIIRDEDGEIKDLEAGARLSLGYKKCLSLLEAVLINDSKRVLNCFGGPGGLVRLASLLNPKLLVATDLLYPGWLPINNTFTFAAQKAFENWSADICEAHNISADRIRAPLFIQMDVKKPNPAFRNTFDVVLIDPPYGEVSSTVTNVDPVQAQSLFILSIYSAIEMLVVGGVISALIPKEWLIESEFPKHLKLVNKSIIGSKEKLLLITMVLEDSNG